MAADHILVVFIDGEVGGGLFKLINELYRILTFGFYSFLFPQGLLIRDLAAGKHDVSAGSSGERPCGDVKCGRLIGQN
jgi:hypothetical protein